ncbi:MAG: OmpA family protein [Arenimonas sp.]|nr:OmpA family protein [Arenimonas sp.]
MKINKIFFAGAVATSLIAMSGFAAAEATKIKGLITAVDGNTITLKDTNNAVQTITVSSDTKIHSTKGMTGAMFETVQQSALMPGLPISAEVENGTASKVSFKSEDFKVAQQVQAGTEDRMNKFGKYDVLETAEVLFDSGKTTISAQGQSDLKAFAEKAKATKDYAVVVQGFTDSTGNAAANQVLSTKRAAAVTNFLQQKGGLQPGRVKSPDGMGIATDAGAGNNAGARKVVVRLVVDQGVAAGNK